MNIVFRVDASAQIGSGHVIRCLTLAKRYRREGHTVSFVMRALPSNLITFVEEAGFSVHPLPYVKSWQMLTGYLAWLTVTQEQDAQETTAVLRTMGQVDRLVIDHYALDFVWESICRPYVREIMAIDDLANRRHDCDILLDQNLKMRQSVTWDLSLMNADCSLVPRTLFCAMNSMR